MRNSSSGAIFYHTKNHFSSVQRAVLHTVIEASNSSCQERRFRPKDADLVIKFYFFWPYIGQKRPRNRGKFLLPLRYELTPEGLIWPSNRTILTPLQTKTTPSFSQNSPVMKSFRLPHTRPFLPHFAEAKKTISRGAKSAPKIGLYFTLRNGPFFWGLKQILLISKHTWRIKTFYFFQYSSETHTFLKLLTWKIFFLRSFISHSLMCFLFSRYSCKLLKIEGRKKGKYVVVGRINESYG